MALNNLFLVEIEEGYTRENFRKIIEEFSTVFLLKNLRFVQISITGNVTNFKFPHNMRIVPKDIIQTSKIGTGTWTWNYDKFDRDNLDITVSGASGTNVVRALVGNLEG
jgi:hypothetical protein